MDEERGNQIGQPSGSPTSPTAGGGSHLRHRPVPRQRPRPVGCSAPRAWHPGNHRSRPRAAARKAVRPSHRHRPRRPRLLPVEQLRADSRVESLPSLLSDAISSQGDEDTSHSDFFRKAARHQACRSASSSGRSSVPYRWFQAKKKREVSATWVFWARNGRRPPVSEQPSGKLKNSAQRSAPPQNTSTSTCSAHVCLVIFVKTESRPRQGRFFHFS